MLGETDVFTPWIPGSGEALHPFKPFIAAFPNPIVLHRPRAGTAAPRARTLLSWYLRGTASADLYAYPPGGGERFLGTKTRDGSVLSGRIALGETYRWMIFPKGNKTRAYDEEEVTAVEEEERLPGPVLTHPPRSHNVFLPTDVVTRYQWYVHETNVMLSPQGLWVEGMGGVDDRPPDPGEVLVGYIHKHATKGWFDESSEQTDSFFRGGLQFDRQTIHAYVGRWGVLSATLKFRVSDGGGVSALARVEQAAEDITGWERLAVGEIPSDGTSFVDLPVGPLRNAATRSYRMTESGLIAADVSRIVYRWASYPDRVHGLVFIGPDESFPENDANRLITHYTDVALELTPSPFLF